LEILTSDHLPVVGELEARCFSAPWSVDGIRETLDEGGSGTVLHRGDLLVGYLLTRRLPVGVEILKLGVEPNQRRRGFARRLVQDGLRRWTADGVESVWLEVRESNNAARRLYAGYGFVEVGRRPHYYLAPVEDALVLSLDLGEFPDGER